MGLDMYLSAEKFISGFDHSKDERYKKILDAMNVDEADADKSVTVSINVGYWRKANAIHQWFVDNVQEGEDNCERYYVSKENLEELKSECEDALIAYKKGDIDVVETILAPASGFFFGSTEIDDGYARDLKDTIEIINKCLTKFDGYSFYYQSSW